MAEKRFLDFLDRIDGGGMGQSGDTFEGGGLLSMLGNLLASPYGSEDPERRARRDAFYAGQMGGEPMAASGFNPAPVRTAGEMATGGDLQYSGRGDVGMPTRDPRPAVLREGMQPAAYEAPSPLERFGGQPPAAYERQYSGRGSLGMPYPEWARDQATRETIDYLRQLGVQGY